MKKTIIVLFAICFLSCNKYSSEVNKALKISGDNKEELIKVLTHYKNQDNKEKLKAAKFLISNLPYNYAYDTTNLYKYHIVYKTIDSIKKLKNKIDLNTYINKFWDSFKISVNPYENIYSKSVIEDIKIIKSDFLIKSIDLAYASWKSNPYTKDSVSFDDFCEYVLPYRQIQGKSIENWRGFFTKNNKNHFSNSYPIPFTKACDSLFDQYKDYRFNYHLAEGLPILKFEDFIKIKEGKCTVKSWLNTYIVNAEGIPMATDFVPTWGNKEDNHQWNALIYGGKTIYFESFWEKNHSWQYNNSIINNLFNDDWSGKIRLPKVYRNTFSTHIVGPISDRRVKIEDIPILFRNIKKKDVSDEYFNTVDLEIELTKIPFKNTYYVYLCVLGVNKQWIPVQWGEINKKRVTFKKMGKDIVYQSGYYKNGRIIPIGNPFHLDRDGKKKAFIPDKMQQAVVIKRKYPEKRGLLKEASLIKGSLIQASNNKDFRNAVTLKEINFKQELRPYEITVTSKKKYRYYRLYSKNRITIRKIDLYSKDNEGKKNLLKGKHISNQSKEIDSITWKGIDLGKPKYISMISFSPLNNLNHVLRGNNYELFYIDKGIFVSLGKKKADSSYELKFDNVPKNALLYLQCLDEGRQERIFTYKKDKQIWY